MRLSILLNKLHYIVILIVFPHSLKYFSWHSSCGSFAFVHIHTKPITSLITSIYIKLNTTSHSLNTDHLCLFRFFRLPHFSNFCEVFGKFLESFFCCYYLCYYLFMFLFMYFDMFVTCFYLWNLWILFLMGCMDEDGQYPDLSPLKQYMVVDEKDLEDEDENDELEHRDMQLPSQETVNKMLEARRTMIKDLYLSTIFVLLYFIFYLVYYQYSPFIISLMKEDINLFIHTCTHWLMNTSFPHFWQH